VQLAQHWQTVPSEKWVVTHNLGRIPIVQILDADNCVVIPAVVNITTSAIEVEFNEPTTGSVQMI